MIFDAEEEVMKFIKGTVMTTHTNLVGIITNIYWNSPNPIEMKLVGFVVNHLGSDRRYILTPYMS